MAGVAGEAKMTGLRSCCRTGWGDIISSSQVSNGKETFLSGVIEGFYGQPWTRAERFELFDWMAASGLNTYLYAPKDDLKHRALWREGYSASEQEGLREIIVRCKNHKLGFVYGLSPGLDIRYHDEADRDQLKKRFEGMRALGC